MVSNSYLPFVADKMSLFSSAVSPAERKPLKTPKTKESARENSSKVPRGPKPGGTSVMAIPTERWLGVKSCGGLRRHHEQLS